MKYKIVYQFRWLIVFCLVVFVYLSNMFLIKLPFIRLTFPRKDLTEGFIIFLLTFLPKINFEFQVYNIQTIIVWASGIIFGPKLSFISLVIYLLIGLLGFPAFAGGGGMDYYTEPTFGYLISLPFLAYLSSWLYENNKKLLSVFVPIFNTHLFGILYLLIFQRNHMDLTWHLSFSMICYDLIFALLLMPLMPFISFFLNEMFLQEVPIRDSSLVAHGSTGRRVWVTREKQ